MVHSLVDVIIGPYGKHKFCSRRRFFTLIKGTNQATKQNVMSATVAIITC